MELLIAVVVCVAFAALAVRFGHDSRDGHSTPERELAKWGVTWDDGADTRLDRGGSTRRPPIPVQVPEDSEAASDAVRYAPR